MGYTPTVSFEQGLTDTDREDWSNLSVANLARAHGDDEPEYSVTSVRHR